MANDGNERLSARITGRVQGVGFRAFTTRQAQDLDVTGWVRNEHDGTVRVEAEGPRSELEQLLQALRQGPRSARVENVASDWGEPDGRFGSFSVRH